MNNSEIISRLAAVRNMPGDRERQVEAVYNEAFRGAFPGIAVSNPYKCDGFFDAAGESGRFGVICEYKYDLDMTSKTVRSKVLAQILFYLRRFEADGKPYPDVAFVGDVDECFIVHTNSLTKFAGLEGVDWTRPPSDAGNDPVLVAALAGDESRNAYVYRIEDGFDFSVVARQAAAVAAGTPRRIRVTEKNVDRVFEAFRRILKEKNASPNGLVGAFFGCMTDRERYYLHPAKKDFLVTPEGGLRVSSSMFAAFMAHFDTNPSPSERRRLTAVADRLIADETRRRQGAFFTPTPFVDYAHGMADREFGEDWRETCAVFDMCCGSKNLTRDYRFGELYCSTLEQSELDISKNYNPEAVSFRFDFLNDPLESLPVPLLETLKSGKKRIVFLFNPPYATAGEAGANGKSKKDICRTVVNAQMKKEKLGNASEQLFAQFLYRVREIKRKFELKDCGIVLFCKPIFMTGSAYEKFRKIFLDDFEYRDGVLFSAGHFNDTASTWGISLTVWRGKETKAK